MNSQGSLWSNLPLSTGIATFVCYAGVFNDVIAVEELASRLGVSGKDEFHTALNDLHVRKRLILRDGFAGLPNMEDRIALKALKVASARQLISSRLDCLVRLGRSPLIRFVGISGSLAASNPTKDRDGRVDLDIFVITRKQCLWLYNILFGIRNLFPRKKQALELCLNYLMDESDLMIATRNFYTATEIRNLIPVTGVDVYRKFLQANQWIDHYYPGLSGASLPAAGTASGSLINKSFYVLFAVLRSIKWLNTDPVRGLSFRTDLRRGMGLNVRSAAYGGYHAMVQKKFCRLAETWFPECLDEPLIEKLFPDQLSAEIRRGEIDVPTMIEQFDYERLYSKYGYQ